MASKPNFSAKLGSGDVAALQRIAARLGLTQKRGAGTGEVGSVRQLLVYIASAEALVMLTALDTGGEMRATAKRLRGLLASLGQDDYEALEQSLGALAAALENAAEVKDY